MARPARKGTGETVRALLGDAQPPRRGQVSEPDIEPIETELERPRRGRPPKSDKAPEKITPARIPANLLDLVRREKATAGDTHETWFLDAYDAVADELAEAYAPRAARRTRMPARQRRTRRPSDEILAAYPLRLSPEELEVLHEHMAELNPPSLADFVTTIVRLRLRQLGYDVP